MTTETLSTRFDAIGERIGRLEQTVADTEAPELAPVLGEGEDILRGLLSAYGEDRGREMPETDDLLQLFKAFVKGDPSLNAVRDNLRELVYYRNCLDMAREDALPENPASMVVHTVRHVYLYLRSRSEQEGRLD